MFSKSKINEPGPTKPASETETAKAPTMNETKSSSDFTPSTPKAKPPASVLSAPEYRALFGTSAEGALALYEAIRGQILELLEHVPDPWVCCRRGNFSLNS